MTRLKSVLFNSFCIGFGLFGQAGAMELQSVEQAGHFEGITITAETLMQYSKPLPADQVDIIQQWFREHSDLMQKINSIPSFNGWQDIFKKNTEELRSQGITPLGTSNPIFEIPGSYLIAKIAGLVNKRQNILQAQGVMGESNKLQHDLMLLYNKQNRDAAEERTFQDKRQELINFHDQQYAQYCQNPIKTYQGMSRAAASVVGEKIKKEFELSLVQFPDAYVVAYDPDTPTDSVSDETHVVLEKRIDGLKCLDFEKEEDRALFRDLSPETVRQFALAAQHTSYWCLKNKLGLVNGTILVFFDTEYPNCSNPADFYYNNKVRGDTDKYIALEQVIDVVKACGNQEHLAVLQTYIADNKDIQNFDTSIENWPKKLRERVGLGQD